MRAAQELAPEHGSQNPTSSKAAPVSALARQPPMHQARRERSYRYLPEQIAKPHRPRHAPDDPSPTPGQDERSDRYETELSEWLKRWTPTNQ